MRSRLGRSQIRNRYGLITRLLEDGKSTDDTEFGVLTARALLDSKGALTPEKTAEAWRRYILDRGGAKKRAGRPLYGAIENLSRGMKPPLTGKFNVMNIDDGAAMRATPHGILWAGNPQRAAESAMADACVSHDADGIWAAQAVAAAVAVAMADGTVEEIVETACALLPPRSWIASAMNTAMDICERLPNIEEATKSSHEALDPELAASPEAMSAGVRDFSGSAVAIPNAAFCGAPIWKGCRHHRGTRVLIVRGDARRLRISARLDRISEKAVRHLSRFCDGRGHCRPRERSRRAVLRDGSIAAWLHFQEEGTGRC